MDKHIQRKKLINKMKSLEQKKQYIMFDLDKKNEEISYWENVVTCSNDLCNFIESLDKIESSYARIPKWQDWIASNDENTHYGYVKNIFKDFSKNSLEDKEIEKRSLYIVNSLLMAIEMCFDRYMDGHNLNKNDYFLDFIFALAGALLLASTVATGLAGVTSTGAAGAPTTLPSAALFCSARLCKSRYS